MLNIKETYDALVELKDANYETKVIGRALRHVGNPLYKLNISFWHKTSAMLVFLVAVILAVCAVNKSWDWFNKILSGLLSAVVFIIALEICLVIIWGLVHLVFRIIQYVRRNDEKVLQRMRLLSGEWQQALAKEDAIKRKLNNSIVPPAYRNLSTVEKFCEYVDNRRVTNIQEAVNLYEFEKAQQQMIQTNKELNKEVATLERKLKK